MHKKDAARPKIKIRLTRGDRVIEITAWILLLGLWIQTIGAYQALPIIIPTHFDIAGNVDGYGEKTTLWILPVLATTLFAGLTILHHFPHLYNYPTRITYENAFQQYTLGTRIIRWVKCIILIIFIVVTNTIIQNAKGHSAAITQWLLPFIFGINFIPLIYFLVRSLKNH